MDLFQRYINFLKNAINSCFDPRGNYAKRARKIEDFESEINSLPSELARVMAKKHLETSGFFTFEKNNGAILPPDFLPPVLRDFFTTFVAIDYIGAAYVGLEFIEPWENRPNTYTIGMFDDDGICFECGSDTIMVFTSGNDVEKYTSINHYLMTLNGGRI